MREMRIVSVLIIIFTLNLFGCGSGDGTSLLPRTAADLVGDWEERSIAIPGVGTTLCEGRNPSLPTPSGGTYACAPLALSFNPDGSYSGQIMGVLFENGTWKLDGYIITITASLSGQPPATRIGAIRFTDKTRSVYIFTFTTGPYAGYTTTYRRIPVS